MEKIKGLLTRSISVGGGGGYNVLVYIGSNFHLCRFLLAIGGDNLYTLFKVEIRYSLGVVYRWGGGQWGTSPSHTHPPPRPLIDRPSPPILCTLRAMGMNARARARARACWVWFKIPCILNPPLLLVFLLSMGLLGEFLQVLNSGFAENREDTDAVLDILQQLSRSSRFGLAVNFLSRDEKKAVSS